MADFVIVVGDNELKAKMMAGSEEVKLLIKETVEDIAAESASVAQFLAPKRTGNLAQNITSTRASIDPAIGGYSATAGVRKTAPYARWVEEGTGIFGPHGTPIVPKVGNFLIFKIGEKTIVTRSVKGQKGQHYMRRAFVQTRDVYTPLRLKVLEAKIGNLIA
jgi:HK97 gp10 family phage protein